MPEETVKIMWQQWERQKIVEGDKSFTNIVKKTNNWTWDDLLKVFNSKLDSLAKHQYNWLHQAEQCRCLKETLSEEETVFHMDFSENYTCKLATEVQAFRFGGNRRQATIHTSVAYTSKSHQSYVTISNFLRHVEHAIWAHLKPVLHCYTALHCMSDGPVTQYRNRKNFYLMNTVPFLSGFKKVTWNFSEKSHGKGAPDGVGGAAKRCADDFVRKRGDVLQDTASSIKYFWIDVTEVSRYDEAVQNELPLVKGTLKIHQIVADKPGKIHHRELSCFCCLRHQTNYFTSHLM